MVFAEMKSKTEEDHFDTDSTFMKYVLKKKQKEISGVDDNKLEISEEKYQ